MSSEPLQEAYRLIREGAKQDAVRILVPLVRADPLNADAWWLLANAVENREQKRQALDRVLKLRPGDPAAQAMLDRLGGQPAQTPSAPPRKRRITLDDEEFAEFDAGAIPISGSLPAPSAKAKNRPRPRGSRRSPLGFILALIGLLTVLSCGICIVIAALSIPSITSFVQGAVLTITAQPFVVQVPLSGVATPAAVTAAPATLPADLQIQGSIQPGGVIQNSVDTYRDDGWTFSAQANQHVIIEVDAVDTRLDPHLYLYDPSGLQIAENDDIDGSTNRNSRIDITLPSAGKYTLRISAFADGGAYKLTLTDG